jgi:hypothetical protein
MRTIVYEMENGTEEVFEITDDEMEQHERAAAEHAVRGGDCKDFRFEEMMQSTYDAIKSGKLCGVS